MQHMPPFDPRIGDVESPASDLDRIVYRIRSTSDRISAESWEEFYTRTYQLGLAELARIRRSRSALNRRK